MFDISILFNTELQILIFFILGLFLKRNKVTNEQADQFLSVFILDFVMPINIFLSFYDNMSVESMKTGYKLILAGAVVAVFIYYLGKFMPSRLSSQRTKIVHYSSLISNGSLIGLPLIQGLCGSEGVFYANLFMISTRILSFALGESFFNPQYKPKNIWEIFKNFITNPITLAMIFGFVFNLCHIQFFSGIRSAMNGLSSCMTPMALLLVGSTLYDSFCEKSSSKSGITRMCFFRLLLAPLITYGVCLLFQLGTVETIAAVLINASPVATTCTIFAKRYAGDISFASDCVCYSTFCSLITLCFICVILV